MRLLLLAGACPDAAGRAKGRGRGEGWRELERRLEAGTHVSSSCTSRERRKAWQESGLTLEVGTDLTHRMFIPAAWTLKRTECWVWPQGLEKTCRGDLGWAC